MIILTVGLYLSILAYNNILKYNMVTIMLRFFALGFTLLASTMFSMTAFACDDKSCEVAYIAETKQYTSNHIRQAEAYRSERWAHSKNRERRAYALYVHMHSGKNLPEGFR